MMNTEQLELKKGQPIVAENHFGVIAGYYTETVVDKNGIWIRFTMAEKVSGKSYPVYIRNINEIRKATVDEVEKINR